MTHPGAFSIRPFAALERQLELTIAPWLAAIPFTLILYHSTSSAASHLYQHYAKATAATCTRPLVLAPAPCAQFQFTLLAVTADRVRRSSFLSQLFLSSLPSGTVLVVTDQKYFFVHARPPSPPPSDPRTIRCQCTNVPVPRHTSRHGGASSSQICPLSRNTTLFVVIRPRWTLAPTLARQTKRVNNAVICSEKVRAGRSW